MMRAWVGIFSVVVMGLVPLAVQADFFGMGGGGDEASATAVADKGSAGTEFKAARVRWLDKQTNRVENLVLKVGTTQDVSGMHLVLTRCVADYGRVPLQDVAWLEVGEDKRSGPWFAGWMFNTYPEAATLDHPRYDLQLLGCGEVARAKANGVAKVAAVSGTSVDGGGAVHDSEAPQGSGDEGGDSAALPDAGSDPFYVPGVGKNGDQGPGTGDQGVEPKAEVAPAAAPAAKEGGQDELHQLMDGAAAQ